LIGWRGYRKASRFSCQQVAVGTISGGHGGRTHWISVSEPHAAVVGEIVDVVVGAQSEDGEVHRRDDFTSVIQTVGLADSMETLASPP
jgi:hypothetical protein